MLQFRQVSDACVNIKPSFNRNSNMSNVIDFISNGAVENSTYSCSHCNVDVGRKYSCTEMSSSIMRRH